MTFSAPPATRGSGVAVEAVFASQAARDAFCPQQGAVGAAACTLRVQRVSSPASGGGGGGTSSGGAGAEPPPSLQALACDWRGAARLACAAGAALAAGDGVYSLRLELPAGGGGAAAAAAPPPDCGAGWSAPPPALVLLDSSPPRVAALTLARAPADGEAAFALRVAFDEPVAWTAAVVAAAAADADTTSGAGAEGALAAAAAALAALENSTLLVADARLLNITASGGAAAAAAPLTTFHVPAALLTTASSGAASGGGAAGWVAVQLPAAAEYEAWFEAPAGAAARVAVPAASYGDSVWGGGGGDAAVTVRGDGRGAGRGGARAVWSLLLPGWFPRAAQRRRVLAGAALLSCPSPVMCTHLNHFNIHTCRRPPHTNTHTHTHTRMHTGPHPRHHRLPRRRRRRLDRRRRCRGGRGGVDGGGRRRGERRVGEPHAQHRAHAGERSARSGACLLHACTRGVAVAIPQPSNRRRRRRSHNKGQRCALAVPPPNVQLSLLSFLSPLITHHSRSSPRPLAPPAHPPSPPPPPPHHPTRSPSQFLAMSVSMAVPFLPPEYVRLCQGLE